MARYRGMVILFPLLVLSGCGTSTKVHGTADLDMQPISEGSISFEPIDGTGPSCGAVIKNGRFLVTSEAPITPGKKRVRIRGLIKTGKQIPAGPPHPADKMIDEVRTFPNGADEEQLQEAEVIGGKDNEFKFNVSSTPMLK